MKSYEGELLTPKMNITRAYSAPHDLQLDLKGILLREREDREKRKGKGKEWREGEWTILPSQFDTPRKNCSRINAN